jgi:hypothetical protein
MPENIKQIDRAHREFYRADWFLDNIVRSVSERKNVEKKRMVSEKFMKESFRE